MLQSIRQIPVTPSVAIACASGVTSANHWHIEYCTWQMYRCTSRTCEPFKPAQNSASVCIELLASLPQIMSLMSVGIPGRTEPAQQPTAIYPCSSLLCMGSEETLSAIAKASTSKEVNCSGCVRPPCEAQKPSCCLSLIMLAAGHFLACAQRGGACSRAHWQLLWKDKEWWIQKAPAPHNGSSCATLPLSPVPAASAPSRRWGLPAPQQPACWTSC